MEGWQPSRLRRGEEPQGLRSQGVGVSPEGRSDQIREILPGGQDEV